MKSIWSVIFISVLSATLTSYFLSQSSKEVSNRSPISQESTYDRVTRTGKLRCGYIIWPPEFEKDLKTGAFTGLAHELVNEIAARLDLEIEWVEEVNFGNYAEGLKTDRYDMTCFSIYRASTRVKAADFTDRLFLSGTGIYVRQGDDRFDNVDVSIFNDPSITISTMDGETAEIIAKEQFPKAKLFSVPQSNAFSDLLLNVSNKKADVTFANRIAASNFMAQNPGLIKDISGNNPLRVFSHGFTIKKNEHEFRQVLNLTIQEMHDQGFIDKLLQKHNVVEGTYIPVKRVY